MAPAARHPARSPELTGASDSQLRALIDAAALLSETLDLETVLKRIVRIACRVVRARYGALGVLNESGTGLARFVFHGISQAQARQIGDLPRGEGILGALIRDATPLRLNDLGSDSRSIGFPDHHPPMRTFLGVPVVAKDMVYGNLYLTEKHGGEPFTRQDEELAVALARQAGLAIENARLYNEVRDNERTLEQRIRELVSLHEIGSALLSELDQGRILRMIATHAMQLTGARSAALAMASEDRETLTLEMVVGRGTRSAAGETVPVHGSLSGRALTTGTAQRTDDAASDGRVHFPVAQALGARSAMFAPLTDGLATIGVLTVAHDQPGRFGDDELELLQSFANMAALALRNARLFAQEQQRAVQEAELTASRIREQMQADLLRQIIAAQEEERRRISRDLHDSAGQTLASLLLGLRVADQQKTVPEIRARIADLRRLTGNAVSEMRRLALELRPTVLDDLGLPAALERYVREFQLRTGTRAHLRIDLADRLPSEMETVVYRVVQEALTNVAKHSKASSVRIIVTRTDNAVRARIRDDGIGFDSGDPPGGGLGLAGMQERAGLVAGTLTIRSSPGSGTTVELEVPA